MATVRNSEVGTFSERLVITFDTHRPALDNQLHDEASLLRMKESPVCV